MTHRSKNSTRVCTIISSVLMLCSCTWGEDYWTDSYIQQYHEINGFHFWQTGKSRFHFIGSGRSASIKSTGEDKVWFDWICYENGDFTYGRNVSLMYGMPGICAYTPNIASIDVYCEDDFDASHPAGSSINEYVKIEYRHAGDYIASGYKDPPYPDLRIQKRQLSEITPEDLKVLLYGPELLFVTKPEKLGIHPLKIVMKTADGKEYSDSFLYNFSNGQLTASK